MEETRICKVCGRELSINEFAKFQVSALIGMKLANKRNIRLFEFFDSSALSERVNYNLFIIHFTPSFV